MPLSREAKVTANIINYNGDEYYDVATFAELTKRSEGTIRYLIYKGNRIRKLRSERIARSLLIPAEELTNYRFCLAGRSQVVERFHADATGYIEQ